MSNTPKSIAGRELYELLPTVYRVRDGDGHLAAYLDACGALLDRVRATLEQRLADAFPTPGPRPAQSWLLPYFADLLDVRLVSPLVDGRREEVGSAVSWRQRKGTLATIEEIADKVGGTDVEIQEGWRRVAVTPRVDRPLLPAAAFGESEPDAGDPISASRHPALPAVTVNVSLPSRAVAADPAHPLAKTTKFRGRSVTWRQLNPHGVPCFPGSFEDASVRTPDVRTPSPSQGHFHPRRLLLFVPPGSGFFPFDALRLKWGDRADRVSDSGGDPRTIQPAPKQPPLIFTTSPPAITAKSVTIDGLVFNAPITVSGGRITLRRAAVRKLIVDTVDADIPVIDAVDCLFDDIDARNGLVRLEGTTVKNSLSCRRLQASDSLFAGTIDLHPAPFDKASCVRWSRIPPGFGTGLGKQLGDLVADTTADPIFFKFAICADDGSAPDNANFGDPGYGVLHPATSDAIRFGAEDGGEMGAGHFRATSLAQAAVLIKLEEFLPVGIEGVLVPDPRLLVEPPRTAL